MDLLRQVARHAQQTLDAAGAAVLMGDRDGSPTPRVMAAAGSAADLLGRVLDADDGTLDGVPVITLPVVVAGADAGTILVLDAGEAGLDDDHGASSLADVAALAAAVLGSVTERHSSRAMLDAGVEAFAQLLNLRDGYTGHHAHEVVEMCRSLGRHLMLGAEAMDELRVAGRLHDLGKIGVPDMILNKPGSLSEDEWAVMRRHPEWGAAALGHVPGWDGVAAAVRGHHERWDGRGYPDGLAAEAIPVTSRIIAIADAWHAMTSDRSYRRALDEAHALRELHDGAGMQFDPVLAEALPTVLERPGRGPRFVRSGEASSRRPQRAGTPDRRPGARLQGARALAAAFDHVAKLPALKESQLRLAEVLANGTSNDPQLLGIVESDLALNVAVLRAANALGGGTPVTGIPDALRVLTHEQLEDLRRDVLPIDYFQRIVGWDQPLDHLRLHALATQRATDRLARLLDRRDRDTLLVGALLHDIGKLVLETAYPAYPSEVHGSAETPDARVTAERQALGMDHAAVGGLLLRRWALPEVLADIVGGHHDPDARGAAAIIRLADMLGHYAHARPVDPHLMLQASAAAGVTPQQLRAIMFDLSQADDSAPRMTEPSPLTRAERGVLRGLADGKTYKEIARDLGLSPSTIRSHCGNVYRKLDVIDRSQAVLHAAQRGWI